MHSLVSRRADREMYLGTFFLRNRAALELISNLVDSADAGSPVRVAVLGCSIGVEVYSIVWNLRRARPDLRVSVHAVDISSEAIRIGEQGRYDNTAAAVAAWPIFDGLSTSERSEMFDWDGDVGTVKSWLQSGITWRVGDASDPEIVELLGRQDFVVANNFLCHMPQEDAERCLRNLARLARSGGYLCITGVDLDVRTRVACDLRWEAIAEMREEIHEGDSFVRADWPWRWWGLEPLNRDRPDWETRYTAVFRTSDDGSCP
jgi:SAM-dependent methyltransferase